MNLPPQILGASVLVTLACLLLFHGMLKFLNTETPQQRLQRLVAGLRPIEEAELEQPITDRIIMPWLRRQVTAAGKLTPARNLDKLHLNLMRAGHPYQFTALDFLGIKLLSAMVVALLAFTILRQTNPGAALLLSVNAGGIGFLVPDFWLGRQVRSRKTSIQRTMPDALDMLTICVDAGAGLDAAMLTISRKWTNAIAREFGRVVAEIGIGKTRREALLAMANTIDLPEMTSFVAVLLQADQFGLSIATVLHTQSEQLRQRRWQRAEEAARKIPIKLLFPLVFLILPALFAVAIGPAVPVLLQTLVNVP